MKNAAYLKKYVENHPNNKMAWYLLGKEYEEDGQEGKAHYCYIQAGSVYEAFESAKIPEDLWMGYEAVISESRREERRSRLARKVGISMVLLLFILIPSANAPGLHAIMTGDLAGGDSLEVWEQEGEQAEQLPQMNRPAAAKQTSTAWDEGIYFTAWEYPHSNVGVEAEGRNMGTGGTNQAASMLQLLHRPEKSGTFRGILGMERVGDWLLWTHRMPLIYGIQYEGNGRSALQIYDDEACHCEPPEASKLKKKAAKWIERQESYIVLQTAIIHYREHTGSWPGELDDLIQPFPNNWLAGKNEEMKKAFGPILDHLKQREKLGIATEEEGLLLAQGSGAGPEQFFAKPLEIVVDPLSHRLAVVSGTIVLRSYQVGLGGDLTPKGTFQITDKVVNPNGRADGEFGSRGMQLSDTNYAIHGTNEPDSIGKDESLGCIRMSQKDIEELFDLVPMGTKVTILGGGKVKDKTKAATSGGFPDIQLVPDRRFALEDGPDQKNPHRTYRWL